MFLSKKNNILILFILSILIGVFLRIYQLNFENYWSPLIKQFEKIIKNKFGNKNLQNQYQVIKKPKELEKILKLWSN